MVLTLLLFCRIKFILIIRVFFFLFFFMSYSTRLQMWTLRPYVYTVGKSSDELLVLAMPVLSV